MKSYEGIREFLLSPYEENRGLAAQLWEGLKDDIRAEKEEEFRQLETGFYFINRIVGDQPTHIFQNLLGDGLVLVEELLKAPFLYYEPRIRVYDLDMGAKVIHPFACYFHIPTKVKKEFLFLSVYLEAEKDSFLDLKSFCAFLCKTAQRCSRCRAVLLNVKNQETGVKENVALSYFEVMATEFTKRKYLTKGSIFIYNNAEYKVVKVLERDCQWFVNY